ncbi:hypothetical protein OPQ81_008469 [Rhizoctonia solani]|nr:hypothetical protein OPQ81_008469 [Rhizoctonia solani]
MSHIPFYPLLCAYTVGSLRIYTCVAVDSPIDTDRSIPSPHVFKTLFRWNLMSKTNDISFVGRSRHRA